MTREEAKALITLCIDDGMKMGVVKESDIEELFDWLDRRFDKPSLPSNLDEAAREWCLDDSFKPWRNLTEQAFKAGAKWMAGQGETKVGFIDEENCIVMEDKTMIDVCPVGEESPSFNLYENELKYGDNVIVQIRKAE